MEERLNALLNSTSPEEAELLSEEFAEFAAGAELPDEAAQHILSSVMQKAGFEMKETITMTKRATSLCLISKITDLCLMKL